ncbi:MAG: TetR/AcrR family transcriptional regulator [Dysgonamonadaceae bacterium]|jgi:AcrR family transcriptional regulator|nr:TetR/AcrR family transcriptional regulator [Dysgonamonadaceae bacterium]
MELKPANTQQIILEAAEKIFIDKGYSETKTVEIAKEAGVNHAMLHYYFRTKENLFNKVFENKANFFLGTFKDVFQADLPFFEKIKTIVEAHFDRIGANPKVPVFVFREIIANKAKRDFILQKIVPAGRPVIRELEQMVDAEVKKGTIAPVTPLDLLLNIASLNVLSYAMAQVYFDFDKGLTPEINAFLAQRKRNNVEVILKSLKVERE